VAGVWNHAQLRSGNRSEHLDGVLGRDDVAVADDEERGRLDAPKFFVGEVRLGSPHGL